MAAAADRQLGQVLSAPSRLKLLFEVNEEIRIQEYISQRRGDRRPRPARILARRSAGIKLTPSKSRSSESSSSPQVAGVAFKCSSTTSEKLCPSRLSCASVSYASVVRQMVV